MNDTPLAGLTVLVTRPAHQAGPLSAMLARLGARVLQMPALEIGGPDDPGAIRAFGERLEEFAFAIFVSPNAVHGALEGLGRPLPSSLTPVAVGPATAKALIDAGYPDVLCADSPFDSEAVLALPQMQSVAGRSVVIFRGDTGRGLLAQVLRERGAAVEYVETYRRTLPPPPTADVAAALRRGQVGAVTATSGQALEQLVAMCGDDLRHGLLGAQLVVVSARMVKLAESLGFRMPLVAAEPGDRALVEALVAWRTGQPPQEFGTIHD